MSGLYAFGYTQIFWLTGIWKVCDLEDHLSTAHETAIRLHTLPRSAVGQASLAFNGSPIVQFVETHLLGRLY